MIVPDVSSIIAWLRFIVRLISSLSSIGISAKGENNCIQPHPLDYPILASSGIDYNIKLFSPLAETPIDDNDRINRTVKRNHIMIQETSSTITVPATLMFRMLTSLYQLRHPDGMSGLDDDADDDD